MRKMFIVGFLAITQVFYGQADHCRSAINFSQMQSQNPARYQQFMQLENSIASYIANQTNYNNARLVNPNGVVLIPVVVHVLHRGESVGSGRNISDVQIQSQIDVLNEDFRRLNPDRVNTPFPFLSIASDFGFEFRLACIDPSGNSTTGITRTLTTKNSFTFSEGNNGLPDEQAIGIKTPGTGRSAWPTNKYLNIWIGDFSDGTSGYASFPSDYSIVPDNDGIVINFTAFGTTGNVVAPRDKGRVATHEVGHWLNLFHIWGDYYCGNDFVDDTPQQESPVYGCPNFPLFRNCANNGPNGDMFMNYMDYSDDGCRNMFTNGQRLRGRAVFAVSPRAAFLNNFFFVNYPNVSYCTGTASLFNPLCLTPTWSIVSGPAYISGGQGTNNVTFTITGTGDVVLRATAGNYVSDQSIYVSYTLPTIGGTYFSNGQEKPLAVWFGDPSNYNNVCNLETVGTNMQVSNATSLTWSKLTSNPSNISWWQSGNNLSFYFWDVNQTAIFRIQASNSCGTATYDFGFISIQCSGGGGCDQYSVSPNPAISEINILVPNIPPPCDGVSVNSSESTSRFISEIRIYDNSGNLKKVQKENKTKKATVNLAGLRAGIYVVEIIDGNYKERHQIIIQQ